MFVSSYIGREGEDYEVQVKWWANELIVKTVAIIVVKSSKNLVRAFSQHIYPMEYTEVDYCLRGVIVDLQWVMQKRNAVGLPMDPVLKAIGMLDLVLGDLGRAGAAEDDARPASATSSEEEGSGDN